MKRKIVYPVTYEKVREIKADYIILNSGRNSGKSYSVKKIIILDHLLKGGKLAYIRRRRDDIKDKDMDYFDDMPIKELTNGQFDAIGSYQKNLYFQKLDEKTGKFINVQHVGRQFAVQSERSYRSHVYKDYTVGVFEEFASTDIYLDNEPDTVQNLVSTILRSNKGVMYMVANLENRDNPYFREWSLVNFGKQKENTIDYYNLGDVKIALYRCPNGVGLNNMAFGHSKKAIDGVEYRSEIQPKLFDDITAFESIYNFVFEFNELKYFIQLLRHITKNSYTLYCTPKTTPIQPNTRLITNHFVSGNPYATNGFIALTQNENIVFNMIRNNNICFSDNLTGSEFKRFYKQI